MDPESPPQTTRHPLLARWGLQTRLYAGIEGVWHVCLFAVCYRYAPVIRLGNSPWGRKFLERAKQFVASRESPNWGQAATATTNFIQTPWKRATAEWFFFNKVFMPVSWPIKLWMAHVWANRIEGKSEQSANDSSKNSSLGSSVHISDSDSTRD